MGSKYKGSELVYGELPGWYDLSVKTNIVNAHKLYEYLFETRQNLLTAYISYILAKAGYDNESIIDMHPFSQNDQVQTTKFSFDDWIRHIDSFNCRGIQTRRG